jgi:rhodanese-related sulfurtransferase
MPLANRSILPAELKSMLPTGCCLIDVREPVEHAEERIEGAQLIPLSQLEKRMEEIDCGKPVILMCRSGQRGMQALQLLERLGMQDAGNLEGGILAWKAAGHPVSRSGKKTLPLMQQVQITIGTGVLLGVVLSQTVHPNFVYLSVFLGAGLVFAGTTGWCGLAILMSKMPWNRVAGQSGCASGNCSN